MEKAYKAIQVLALVFGIFAPTILLSGYIYHIGYINAFGLDISLMNRGLGDMVAESWLLGIRLFPYLNKIFYMGAGFVVFLALALLGFAYFISLNKIPDFLKSNEELSKDNQGKIIFGLTHWKWKVYFEAVSQPFVWFLIFCVSFLLLGLLFAQPYTLGNEFGFSQIETLKTKGCQGLVPNQNQTPCAKLIDLTKEDDNLLSEGILVTANSSHVAFFTGDKLEVWPLLDTYKIERPYKL